MDYKIKVGDIVKENEIRAWMEMNGLNLKSVHLKNILNREIPVPNYRTCVTVVISHNGKVKYFL